MKQFHCILAAILVAASIEATTLATRTTCSGGQYTDTLCVGDHLVPNSYLASANGNFRFYYQNDGNANVFDVSDFENWVFLYTLYQDTPDYGVGWFSYGEEDEHWSVPSHYSIFDPYGTIIGGAAASPVEGEHFFRLDNDGCIRIYDQGGSRWAWSPGPAWPTCGLS